MPLQVVVMGVSGTGKSTVATALADQLGWPFVEGDDLHPRSNVAKMESGEPLTDDDRAPWLEAIRERALEESRAGRSAVITCSALKRQYRDSLREGVGEMFFVHLHGTQDVLEPRMAKRERHFMPPGLLQSQLDTLEPLRADEDGVVVDISGTVDEVIALAQRALTERLHN
jgi:gluconokinase